MNLGRAAAGVGMRASACVGRVGGLAVALGVWTAIAAGVCAPAHAAPAEDSTATVVKTSGSGSSAKSRNSAPPLVEPPSAGRAPTATRPGLRERMTAIPSSVGRRSLPALPVAGSGRSLDRVAGRDVPGESTPASGVTQASVTAQASTGGFLSVLFNASPTASPTHGAQTVYGVISGSVNAADPDSPVLKYSLTSAPAQGTVQIAGDGSYTYTPDPEYAATGTVDSFTISVSDEAGGFHLHGLIGLLNLLTFGLVGGKGHDAAATITLSVTPFRPPNSAPTGVVSLGMADFSGTIAGSVAGADIDGDPLTYGGTKNTVKGSVTVAGDGSFTYTPTPAARHASAATSATTDKTDTFSVIVSDGQGGVTAVPVTVPISPTNIGPTATASVGGPSGSTGVVAGSVSGADGDGDSLTYFAPATTSKGTVSVGVNGAFTYTPNSTARHAASASGAGDADKSDIFTVTVSDGHGGTASVPITVAIGPANAAPTGSANPGIPNASTGVVTGSVAGVDPDGDSLNYAGSATTAKGSVVVGANGSFTYTPSAPARHTASSADATNADKTDSFVVSMNDGHGGTAAVSVTVAIGAANAVPTGSAAVEIPNVVTGVVAGILNVSDADGDSLTYSGSTATAKGSVTVAPSGTFTYTPNPTARHLASAAGATESTKTDSFIVTISDGHGGTVAIPVSVAVGAANAAPSGVATVGSPTSSTGVVTGSVSGVDADGDPVTFSGTTTTAKGSVTVNPNGSFTYTPTSVARHAASISGGTSAVTSDTFSVILGDGHGGSTAVPVTVAISPTNIAPTATGIVGLPNVDTGTVTGTITAADADGDSFTYNAPATAKGSVVVNANGSFAYTPTDLARHTAARQDATALDLVDSFSITVLDGHGGSVSVPLSVSISPASNPPTGSATVGLPNPATGVVAGTVVALDPDGDLLTYSAPATTSKGSVAITANGSFAYTPDSLARHAASTTGATSAQTTDTFTITVSDGHGGRLNLPVTVAISPVNTAPSGTSTVAAPNALTGVVTGAVLGTDADGDSLKFSGTTTTAKGSVTVATDGTFSYTPNSTARHNASASTATAADKTDSFTVTVSDGHGAMASVPVTVTIGTSNTAPSATATAATPNASTGVVTGSATGTDADGDSLTYSGSTTTSKGTVVVAPGGTFTYTPNSTARHAASASGASLSATTDTFDLTVSDGHGGSSAVPVTVTIAPANVAPIGSGSPGAPNPSTGVVTGSVVGSDVDGDALVYSGSTTTSKGSVVVNANGSFTYTPTATARHAASATGATAAATTDTFTVTIADGHGGTVGVAVTVAVGAANTGPTATSTVGTPNLSGVVTGTVVGSDADGDTVTYSGTTTTAKGSVTVGANGSFTYTPNLTARHVASALTASASDKTDAFTVTVSDGHGGTYAVVINVPVAPTNSAPTATVNVGSPNAATGVVAGAVIGSDLDGDVLTYGGSATTEKGSVTVAADGGFTYTPTDTARYAAASASAADADLSDSFSVTVSDAHGGTVTVSVTVAVAPMTPHISFVFNYGSGAQYWTTAARTAMDAVAGWLSSNIVVTTPVTLTYDVVGASSPNTGNLASAFTYFASSSPGFYGTIVQAKILTGVDLNGSAADGQISWNFAYPWAFGASVRNNQYDFTSTAIHELLHTLGFLSGIADPSTVSSDRNYTTYDSFITNSAGTKVIGNTYVWNTAYTANLTGSNGGLYFSGANAVAAYGGLVPIYTPSTWSSGSSISHLSDTNPNADDQVMNPYASYGVGARVLSPVEVGILKDLGYTVDPQSPLYAFVVVFGVWRLRRRR